MCGGGQRSPAAGSRCVVNPPRRRVRRVATAWRKQSAALCARVCVLDTSLEAESGAERDLEKDRDAQTERGRASVRRLVMRSGYRSLEEGRIILLGVRMDF